MVSSFILTFDQTWLTNNNNQVSPPIGGITGLVEVTTGAGMAEYEPGEMYAITIVNTIQIVGEFTSFGNGANSWVGAAGLVGITIDNSASMISITDLSGAFNGCVLFTDTAGSGLDQLDVTNVTDMSYMFKGCTAFNNTGLANWERSTPDNTSTVTQVTDMSYMFESATAMYTNGHLNVDLTDWSVGNIAKTNFLSVNGSQDITMTEAYSPFTPRTTLTFTGPCDVTLPISGFSFLRIKWNTDSIVTYTEGPIIGETGGVIHIKGNFTTFGTGSTTWQGAEYLTDITAWGSSSVSSLSGACNGCGVLNSVATIPSNVVDTSYMFYDASGFTGANIESWTVNAVTDMSHMFEGATAFNNSSLSWATNNVKNMSYMFKDATNFGGTYIDQWNIGNVTDMSHMFEGATAFNNTALGSWRNFASSLISVGNMSYMFKDATSFEGTSIDNWNVVAVTDMSHMFEGATAFNNTAMQAWNQTGRSTTLVANMSYMFKNATSFVGTNIDQWDVSGVTNMSHMFEGATEFNNASLSYWNTIAVNDMSYMFMGASKFIGSGIDSWDVNNVTDMSHMFDGALVFNNTNLGNWNKNGSTTEFITNMSYMFKDASGFTGDTIQDWNVSAVIDMSFMFYGADAFNGDLSLWEREGSTLFQVQDMSNMFNLAISFDSDLSNWNTGSVETMAGMFNGATEMYNEGGFKYDLSQWNVTNVESFTNFMNIDDQDMTTSSQYSPFYEPAVSPVGLTMVFDPNSLGEVTLPISGIDASGLYVNWGNGVYEYFDGSAPITGTVTGFVDVSGVFTGFGSGSTPWTGAATLVTIIGAPTGLTNLTGAFNGATIFDGTGVDSWDVSKVTEMSYMFTNATAFNNTNLSQWDVSGVQNMTCMFQDADAFTGTGIESWNVSAVTNMASMFQGADAFNADLSLWEREDSTLFQVQEMSNMFNAAVSFDSDLSNWNTGSVETMVGMFNGATEMYAEGFKYDLSQWDITNVGTNFTDFMTIGEQDITTISPFSPFTEPIVLTVAMTLYFDPLTVGEVTLPITGIDTNGLFVDWYDGSGYIFYPQGATDISGITTGQVDIAGGFSGFGNGSTSWAGVGSLIDISGTPTGLTNLSGAFNGASRFYGSSLHELNVSGVTDMSYMFTNASYFSNTNLGQWDVSEVLNMSHMFQGADSFTGTGIESWNVSKVTDMSNMFFSASAVNNLNLTNWERSSPDTSSLSIVQDVSYMFYHANGLYTDGLFNMNLRTAWTTLSAASRTYFLSQTGYPDTTTSDPHSPFFIPPPAMTLHFTPGETVVLPISGIDASGIYVNFGDGEYVPYTNESDVISGIASTGEVIVSGVFTDFGIGADSWIGAAHLIDVSGTPTGLTNLSGAFNGATQFVGSTIHTWDVSLVTDMSYMFKSAEVFNNQNLGNWERVGSTTALVQNMGYMFINASNFVGTGIESWNVSDVHNMLAMFAYCPVNTNLAGWERDGSSLSTVTTIDQMFLQSGMYTDGVLTYDLRGWNVESVQTKGRFLSTDGVNDLTFDDQYSPFYTVNPHVNPNPLSLIFTPGTAVTLPISGIDSSGLFVDWHDGNGYTSYPQGSTDITGITTGQVDISGVFTGFGLGAESWIGVDSLIDISGTPSGLTNLAGAFHGASSFIGTDLHNLDTSNVTDMSYMFAGAAMFNSTLNWDVSKVTSMAYMFIYASSFAGANIENWNVSLVEDMTNMFNSSGLANTLLGNWERAGSTLATVSSMAGMFANASNMYTGSFQANLTGWNVTSVTNRNLFLSPSNTFSEDTSTSDQNSPFYTEGSASILPFALSFATNPIITNIWTNPEGYPAGSILYATVIGQGGAGSTGEVTGGSGAGIQFMYTFTDNVPVSDISSYIGTGGGKYENGTSAGEASTITFTDRGKAYVITANGGTAALPPPEVGQGSGTAGSGGEVVITEDGIPVTSIPGLQISFSGTGTPTQNGYEAAGGQDPNLMLIGLGGTLGNNGADGYIGIQLSLNVTLPVSGIDGGGLMVNFGTEQKAFSSGPITGLTTGDVFIFGNFTTFGQGATPWPGVDLVTTFLQWGSANIIWNASGAFNGATQLTTVVPTSVPFTIQDMSYMFNNATGFYSNGLLSYPLGWDVSYVTSSTFFLSPDGITDTTLTDSGSPFYVEPTLPYAMTLTFTPAVGMTLPIGGIDASGLSVDMGDGNGFVFYADDTTPITTVQSFTGEVIIRGHFTRFGFGYYPWQGVDDLLDISGTPTGLTDLSGAFLGATKFVGSTIHNWDVSKVTDMSKMFYGASGTFNNQNLGNWDVSGVLSMSGMFQGAGAFTGDTIDAWNVSAVTNMSNMFTGAEAFNNQNLGNWERTESTVAHVEDMSRMFQLAASFSGGNINTWNVSAVTDMSNMFERATAIYMNGFSNVDLSDWTTTALTGVPPQFFDATGSNDTTEIDPNSPFYVEPPGLPAAMTLTFDSELVVELPIGGISGEIAVNWGNGVYQTYLAGPIMDTATGPVDVSGVFTSFGFGSTSWTGAANLLDLTGTPSGLTDLSGAFNGASQFVGSTIHNWDVSLVTNMSYMFNGTPALTNMSLGLWVTGSVQTMSHMFNGSGLMDTMGTGIDQAGIDQWDVTNVADMSYMFANLTNGCTNTGLGNWERVGSTVANVTSMAHMFDTTGFVDVPTTGVDNWNVSGVVDFSYMFANSSGFNNTSLGNWNLSPNESITMAHMFDQSSFVDVSGTGVDQWNVTSVTDMSYMFANTSFANQGLGSWESQTSTVANVKTFAGMFSVTNAGPGFGPTGLAGIDAWVIGATDMSSMFKNNSNFSGSSADPPILLVQWESNTNGSVTSTMADVTSVAHMFDGCTLMTDAGGTQGVDMWNLSSVTDMSFMFKDCANFDNDNLGNWGTTVRQVKDMSSMFAGSGLTDATAFGVNLWDVSGVTNMSNMFNGASSFANPNLSNWNTSSVTDMSHMFQVAIAFPGTGLEGWNVSLVVDFNNMFSMGDSSEFFDNDGKAKIDLTGWNVSNSTDSSYFFFVNSTDTTTTDPRSPFWTPTTSPMTLTFLLNEFTPVITLPISGISGDIHVDYGDGRKQYNLLSGRPVGTVTIWGQFTSFSHYDPTNTYQGWPGVGFLQSITGWENPGITDLSGACMGSNNLVGVPTVLPSGVTNLSYLFAGCGIFEGTGIEQWDVTNITDMSYLFTNATTFNNTNLGQWATNTSNVQTMTHMFDGASSFTGTSIENWDVSEVTNMSFMFANSGLRNETLGDWNTSKVNTMASMFQGIYDFSGNSLELFDVSGVTDMSYMFANTNQFNNTALGSGYWHTSNVQTMAHMFDGALAFVGTSIEAWDVSGVSNMAFMFANTEQFNNVALGSASWKTSNVKSMAHMFDSAVAFVGTSIESWDVYGVTNMTSMFNTATLFDNSSLSEWVPHNVTDMTNMFVDASGMYDAGNFKYDLRGWDVTHVTSYTNFMFTTEDISKTDPYSPFFEQTYDPVMTLIFTEATSVELPISGIDASGLRVNWNDGSGYVFYPTGSTGIANTASRVDIAGNFTTFGLGTTQWQGVLDLSSCTISPSATMTSLSGAFRATGMDFVPPPSIPATVTDLSYLFATSAFSGRVGGWDVTNVLNMSRMFLLAGLYGTGYSDDLSNWNVRKVTDMQQMFAGSVTDGSGYEMWQPVACTVMSSMFAAATNMSANLTSWAYYLRPTVINTGFFTTTTFGCSGLTNPVTESSRSPFYADIPAPSEPNFTSIASFTSPPNPTYQLGNIVYGMAGDTLFSINTNGNVYTALATLTGTPLGAVTANVLSFDQTIFGIVTGSPSALFFYKTAYGTVGTFLGTPNPYITYDAPGNLYTTDSTGNIYKVAATNSFTSSSQTLTILTTTPTPIVGPLSVSNNILYGPNASGSIVSVNLATLTVATTPQVPRLGLTSCLVDTGVAYFYDPSGLTLNRYDIASQVSTQLWDFSGNPLSGTEPVSQILIDSIAQKLYGICSSDGPGLGNGNRGAGTMWSYTLPSGPLAVLTSYVTGDLTRGSTPSSFTITTERGVASVVTAGGNPTATVRFRPRTTTYLLGSVLLPGYNVSCFNHGTKILRQVHGADVWSPVETLRRGDLIKTYKHGYRAITNIGKGILINDPNVWHSCMYQGQKEGHEPLIVTGGHAFLVDGLTQEEQKKQEIYWARDEHVIDDKLLMVAPVCKDFKPIMTSEIFTYYHFTVENDGDDDRRYGVWANGFLTETPSINQYKLHKYHSL
jgi:surface protein